jgi:L-seryl-tRNA(Ser) seleniumtransferase
MPRATAASPFAALPGIDALLAHPDARALRDRWGRGLLIEALRNALDEARADIREDRSVATDPEELLARAARVLRGSAGRGPVPVLNLTGTVIHTNLGRAPLPTAAIEALVEAAGATDLEYDLATGTRGERDHHVERLLCDLTGAEAATVVNNNAAAVLLVLNTFAMGREVPVSRGELVEIGGSFRVPEIMQRAGARLVEVGTTNRTHPHDLEAAIGPDTGLLMKIHPSNYAIQGFTRELSLDEMGRIGRARGLPSAWDMGSGSLVDLSRHGLEREPMPRDGIEAGIDLITFSGDKLLGGPQAGIVVGSRDTIDALRRNPLKRALRVDKLTLAALAAVLRLWSDPATAADTVPALALLKRSRSEIRARARGAAGGVAEALGADWHVEQVDLDGQIGSGALPVARLESAGLALRPVGDGSRNQRLATLQQELRHTPVPVIGRIHDDRLLLDCRCLEDPAQLIAQFRSLAGA